MKAHVGHFMITLLSKFFVKVNTLVRVVYCAITGGGSNQRTNTETGVPAHLEQYSAGMFNHTSPYLLLLKGVNTDNFMFQWLLPTCIL